MNGRIKDADALLCRGGSGKASLPADGREGRQCPFKVLVVEDVPTDVELMLRELRRLGIDFVHEAVYTRDAFLDALDRFEPDIVLSDYAMPQFTGMEALRLVQDRGSDLPFIVVTGSQNEEVAVECMKAGASDYIIKDRLRRLGPAVQAVLEKFRVKREKDMAEAAARQNRIELDMAIAGSGGAEWEVPVDPIHPDELPDEMKMSPRLKAFIGFSDHELASTRSAWFDRIHPDDVARIEASTKAHREGRAPAHQVEYRIRHRDGTWRWIASIGRLQRDERGRPVRWAGIDWDVTERKQAEEALRTSEERYRTLYRNMRQGVHEVDASGTLVSVNPASAEILGIETTEFVGRPMSDFYALFAGITQEDGRPFEEEGQISLEVLRTGKTVRDRLIRLYNPKKGRYIWISMYSMPRYEPGRAEPAGAFTVYSDVTELKDARDSLHRLNVDLERRVEERTASLMQATNLLEGQKEVLQTIMDHIPVMVVLCSSSRDVVLVNREFERLTGWSLDEARTEKIAAACFPDPSYRKEVMALARKADPGWREFDLTTRSGGTLRILWAAVAVSDGHIGIGIDITERRKMEQDILRLAAAAQQTGEGIGLTGLDGVIEYVNPALETITGYSRDELVGRSVDSIPGFLGGTSEAEIFENARREGRPWSGRQTRRRKTGETIEVDVTISPVRNEAGRIINTVSVTKDVTREVRMQRQIAQTQKLEAIGALAGGIAHDLKNILTPILINTETALEEAGEESPVRPVLEETLHAARLGRDLVQQILTFSRRTPPKKGPVNVPEVIRETLAFLRSTMPSSIEIQSEVKDDCAMAIADPTQIKQALINLGGNAGQAMLEGGTLDVVETVTVLDEEGASRVSPDLAPGPYIQVAVRDTGKGMDGEVMEHIFEPFFTTRKGDGTGMGLAVVHGIVKEHQGAVTVQSRPGEGSTFTVYLPVATEACAPRAAG